MLHGLLVGFAMGERIIENLLIVVALSVLGAWVTRHALSARGERDADGHIILTYPIGFRVFGSIGCGLIALFSFVLPISQFQQRDTADPIYIIVWWSIGGWMIHGVFKYVFTRIEVRKDGFVSRGAWRKPRFVSWSDVKQVSWNAQCKWFVIKAADRTTMRASLNLSGIRELHRELKRRVPASA